MDSLQSAFQNYARTLGGDLVKYFADSAEHSTRPSTASLTAIFRNPAIAQVSLPELAHALRIHGLAWDARQWSTENIVTLAYAFPDISSEARDFLGKCWNELKADEESFGGVCEFLSAMGFFARAHDFLAQISAEAQEKGDERVLLLMKGLTGVTDFLAHTCLDVRNKSGATSADGVNTIDPAVMQSLHTMWAVANATGLLKRAVEAMCEYGFVKHVTPEGQADAVQALVRVLAQVPHIVLPFALSMIPKDPPAFVVEYAAQDTPEGIMCTYIIRLWSLAQDLLGRAMQTMHAPQHAALENLMHAQSPEDFARAFQSM
jgi:hypothetical protein